MPDVPARIEPLTQAHAGRANGVGQTRRVDGWRYRRRAWRQS